jgi:hypothetical protein
MTLLAFKVFGGEVPRLSETLLPDGAAQDAANCDLAHGELRGMRGDRDTYPGSAMGAPLKAVYTEDGATFFGWAYDTHAVRSMVQGDIHYRIYYTQVLEDGPIAKVARTQRNTNGVLDPVIGGYVPRFYPPEYTTPGWPGGSGTGPDSWLLGVPLPKVQADITQDNLVATLVDKPYWPDSQNLRLRVTVFYEDAAGNIVQQYDASNNEAASFSYDDPGPPPTTVTVTYDNVYYTNNSADRGFKIQDMLYPLGYARRPYKYYWFDPQPVELTGITKPVIITNAGPNDAEFSYTTSEPAPNPIDPAPPVTVA